MANNPKLKDFSPEQARPTMRSTLSAMWDKQETFSRHVAAKKREVIENIAALSRSPAHSWLVGVLREVREKAARAETAAWDRGDTHAAAFNSGARENASGLLRLLTRHTKESEDV